jgi:hypothetical protein
MHMKCAFRGRYAIALAVFVNGQAAIAEGKPVAKRSGRVLLRDKESS